MTETENNSTASTVKDKTESVSEQNENNTSGSNDNSAAGGGDSGFENIGKTSKGFNIQVKNGATYIALIRILWQRLEKCRQMQQLTDLMYI